MKKVFVLLLAIAAMIPFESVHAQHDRLAELNVVCRNWAVTHISVATDGSLWMATGKQVLREAMPDSMQLREYLDNSTLHPRYTLQSGDLLFLTKNKSEMENAITASTGEYTHVALVERDNADDVWVIEASPKDGVRRTSYSQFEREHRIGFFSGSIDIYRLTVSFDTAAVINRAKSLVGKPYDDAFLPDNDAYYCSELIQVAFGDLFESKPMNWRDANGNLPEYWTKHFEELNMPVPEGIVGTNPTDMSRSPLLKKLSPF